ncbi:hypothetical protein [Primorskyibacter sp. S87]|uniref:hypothetical protein n=1 Tax=Primorskyibacter sp. S87 TaxID=3415126 RepID=UPI003C7BF704
MNNGKLKQLAQVTHALYLQEKNTTKPVLAKAAKIRGHLSHLDQLEKNAAPQLGDIRMRAVGADMVWRAWEGKTRRQLNVEMAQAHAHTLIAMTSLRAAFGRDQAIQMTLKAHSSKQKQRIAKAALQNLVTDG